MKSKFLFSMVILALLAASCKKAYTCNCTIVTTIPAPNGGFGTVNSQTKEVAYSEKMSESQAKAACNHEKTSIESVENNFLIKNGNQPNGGSAVASCGIH